MFPRARASGCASFDRPATSFRPAFGAGIRLRGDVSSRSEFDWSPGVSARRQSSVQERCRRVEQAVEVVVNRGGGRLWCRCPVELVLSESGFGLQSCDPRWPKDLPSPLRQPVRESAAGAMIVGSHPTNLLRCVCQKGCFAWRRLCALADVRWLSWLPALPSWWRSLPILAGTAAMQDLVLGTGWQS